MKVKKTIKKIIDRLVYVKALKLEILDLKKNSCYPAGHFYSPVVAIEDIKKRQSEIWKNIEIDGIQGIDLKTNQQKELIESFTQYYNDLPFSAGNNNKTRYQFENDY